MRSSIELPPMRRLNNNDITSEPFPTMHSGRPRELLPSILSTSPPGRSSTLPPIQRPAPTRPRKASVSKRAREPQHNRQKSREKLLGRRMSYDRKAYSAEPSSHLSAYGKRWEDLIDAATSATEDVDEDRTPVSRAYTVQFNLIKMKFRYLNLHKFLSHHYPSTAPPCHHSQPPIFKAIRPRHFSKLLPLHLTLWKLLNLFLLLKASLRWRAATTFIWNHEISACPTPRRASHLKVYRYTVRPVRA